MSSTQPEKGGAPSVKSLQSTLSLSKDRINLVKPSNQVNNVMYMYTSTLKIYKFKKGSRDQ